MKKVLIFSLVAFSFSTLKAQSPSFGIKAGANYSTVLLKDNNSTDYATGLHAGALAHFHLSKTWALQPEVLYSIQGAKESGSYNNKLRLNYINVPVLLQYMFQNGFRLQAGPQIGFLISAKSKLNDEEHDVKDSFKSTDFSFPIGLGYLSKSGLGIDGRWVPGLSNIQKDDYSPTNHVFQLGLFYQFGNHK